MKMKKLALSFILILNSWNYTQNFWQPLNGPVGAGYIMQISLSPNGQLFLSTLGGGIYRSSDNGNTWVQKITGFPSPIYDDGTVVFAFNGSGHIYATSFTQGIWRSTNNGDTWTQTGLSSNFYVAIEINQSGYIFAAHGGGGGIFRSTDNGSTWSAVNNGLPLPMTFHSLLVKPGGLLFAGGNSFAGSSVFKSSNNGGNWISCPLYGVQVNSLALNNNGDLYAGTGFNGVYRSINSGDNWIQADSGLYCKRINQVYCDYQGYIFAATDTGLFRSTNGGNFWTRIGFNNRRLPTVISLPNGSYFAGVYMDGIYKSINHGTNWIEANNGINALTCYSAAINQSGHIFAGLDYKLVQKSTDNGQSWLPAKNGLMGTSVNILAAAPNNYIFARTDSGVFRSTNGGNNWQIVFGNMIPLNDFVFRQNGYIYAPSSYPGFGVWVSTNNGLNWTMTSPNFTASVYSLAINQIDYLFAGTAGGGVYRSINYGLNWTQVGPYSSVTAIAVAPNYYVYAAMRSVPQGSDGIYRSTNNGATWQYMGLNVTNVSSIKINSAGYIYAAYLGGVYCSTNTGNSWTQLSSGLFNNMVLCLAFNPQGYLYAGTWGNSIYRSVNSTIGIEQISTEIPENYSLIQNYPNPFNPITNIEFSIPNLTLVTLVIYDIQGRELESIVNENLKAGTYKANWNASNFSSGVYLYRLIAADYVETRKMILIK